MAQSDYGLGSKHCECVTNAHKSCLKTKELLDKLEKIGLDVSQLKQRNDQQADLAAKFKAEFFPDAT